MHHGTPKSNGLPSSPLVKCPCFGEITHFQTDPDPDPWSPSKPSSFGCKDSRDLDGFQAPAPNPRCSHPHPAGSPGLECRRDLDSRRQDARFGRNGTSLAEKMQRFIGFYPVDEGELMGIMSEGDGIDPGTVNEAVCETTVQI